MSSYDHSPHTNYAECIRVYGQVQGVGFRPVVWKVATNLALRGNVFNDGNGVTINVYGNKSSITTFLDALQNACPPLARIDKIEQQPIPYQKTKSFQIGKSIANGANTPITPDAATCPDCLSDINSPTNRRYKYPFTNCTHCGPRLSIIKSIPYDRKHTSMHDFKLCDDCSNEYNNPKDRRFHAQPNACAHCGPELWTVDGSKVIHDNAIDYAAIALKEGRILALKGIGGFHLICDALNADAVTRLRVLKNRPHKPFALMASSVEKISRYTQVSGSEKAALQSQEAPIVLMAAIANNGIPDVVAPGQRTLGFMLPHSPIHHLLLNNLHGPIVATSGNAGGQPPCIDNAQAQKQLASIADIFLLHNRPILNRVDDSVVRQENGNQLQILRRARGYAPTPIKLPIEFSKSGNILALGGTLKNTFCLIKNGEAVLSQHIGDLENLQTFADFQHNLNLYLDVFQYKVDHIGVDSHPDYLSTKHGIRLSEAQHIPCHEIQHHHAHIASCLADNHFPVDKRVIGIALDGSGYGDDHTLWGGEILLANYTRYTRLAHLIAVPLAGGLRAIQQPWRNLVSQLSHAFGSDWQDKLPHNFSLLAKHPTASIQKMIDNHFNCPLTSSTGRLFDAVAAALGICTDNISYEGQAAIALEAATSFAECLRIRNHPYRLSLEQPNASPWVLDTKDLWPELLADIENKKTPSFISARFHTGLAYAFANTASILAEKYNITYVALSGGVIQNQILSQLILYALSQKGLYVLQHKQVPANDGGLSLGQAVITAARTLQEESPLCA